MKLICVIGLILWCHNVSCINKYSKEANTKLTDHFDEDPKIEIRNIDKPFRMAKLNLLWAKAKLRLSEPKLKSFYSDLKIHDKEEIAFKHFIAVNSDKDGLKEAELRKKLIGIMSTYNLLEHFQDLDDVKKVKEYDNIPEAYLNKNVFKDKKLNKLWIKAELAGFNSIELQILKEEFSHHQDKIDQYHAIINNFEENKDKNAIDEDLNRFNTIDYLEESNEINQEMKHENKINEIRNRGREIKDGFDRLERLAAQGPNSEEFVEPKVQNLWRQALNGSFSQDELQSLRTELHHYEKRLLKLRNLHLEVAIGKLGKDKKLAGEKLSNLEELETLIKKQSRKAEKLHTELESKILYRNEL